MTERSPPPTLVAVVGPGEDATEADVRNAYALGSGIARAGWTLLTGGRAAGVMDAASRGARDAGGLTVGVLPGTSADDASPAVQVPIITGIGEARNQAVVLSARAVVACGMNPGTAVEVALALGAGRPVVLLAPRRETREFFALLGDGVAVAGTPEAALAWVARALAGPPPPADGG